MTDPTIASGQALINRGWRSCAIGLIYSRGSATVVAYSMIPYASRFIEIPGLNVRFRRPPRPVSVFVIIALIGIVEFVDYITGEDLVFSIFYLIPITAAIFLEGGIAGAATAFVSVAVGIALDLVTENQERSLAIFIWSNLVQLGFFLLHALLISRLLSTIKEVRALSLHDPLTAAANWRLFEEQAEDRLKFSRRNGTPISFAYIDLDNFKTINDTYGHHVGNEVLKTVADSIQSEIRPHDLLARLGGDEFGLLLEGARRKEIRTILDRILAETCRRLREREWPVTLSLGAVTYRRPPASVTEMVKEADRLMYRVKRSGKNKILYAEKR